LFQLVVKFTITESLRVEAKKEGRTDLYNSGSTD
jgi:hypothetical protein